MLSSEIRLHMYRQEWTQKRNWLRCKSCPQQDPRGQHHVVPGKRNSLSSHPASCIENWSSRKGTSSCLASRRIPPESYPMRSSSIHTLCGGELGLLKLALLKLPPLKLVSIKLALLTLTSVMGRERSWKQWRKTGLGENRLWLLVGL